MGLADDHVEELNLLAVPVVELLDRRNCTRGDRSSTAAEVQEHRSVAVPAGGQQKTEVSNSRVLAEQKKIDAARTRVAVLVLQP
jgi:hypothetical protein